MFEKKSQKGESKTTEESLGVFRPAKGTAKVIIGNGVTLKGDITEADEVDHDLTVLISIVAINLVINRINHQGQSGVRIVSLAHTATEVHDELDIIILLLCHKH